MEAQRGRNDVMGKQTDKSRYQSLYSPEKFVTAAQYIIERVCERKAANLKVDLPIKFWNLPEWQLFFKSQLRKCHTLLKKYHEKAIIRALQDKEASRIYSLHAPWLIPVIERYNKIVLAELQNLQKITTQPVEKPATISQIRQRRVRSTPLGKLKDLDNEV